MYMFNIFTFSTQGNSCLGMQNDDDTDNKVKGQIVVFNTLTEKLIFNLLSDLRNSL